MLRTVASVFLLSHNKGRFAVEAARSVLAQDEPDLELWILENSTDGETRDLLWREAGSDPRVIFEKIDLTPAERDACYVPAMLLNRYYPQARGRFIFYLSDDDLLHPDCVSRCAALLGDDKEVCYFSHLHVIEYPDGRRIPDGEISALDPLGWGTDAPIVDSRIDGGQIAHTRACLDAIEQPWFPENANPGVACHADGLFMQKL